MQKLRVLLGESFILTACSLMSLSVGAAPICGDVFKSKLKEKAALVSKDDTDKFQSDLFVNGYFVAKYGEGRLSFLKTYRLIEGELVPVAKIEAPSNTHFAHITRVSSDTVATNLNTADFRFGINSESHALRFYQIKGDGSLVLKQMLEPQSGRSYSLLSALNSGSDYILVSERNFALNEPGRLLVFQRKGDQFVYKRSIANTLAYYDGPHPDQPHLHILRSSVLMGDKDFILSFNEKTGKHQKLLGWSTKDLKKDRRYTDPIRHMQLLKGTRFILKGETGSSTSSWFQFDVYGIDKKGDAQFVKNFPMTRRNIHTPFARRVFALGESSFIMYDNHSYLSGADGLSPVHRTFVRDLEIKVIQISESGQVKEQLIPIYDSLPLAFKGSQGGEVVKNPEAVGLSVQVLNTQEFLVYGQGQFQVFRSSKGKYMSAEKVIVGDLRKGIIKGSDSYDFFQLNKDQFIVANVLTDNVGALSTQLTLFQKVGENYKPVGHKTLKKSNQLNGKLLSVDMVSDGRILVRYSERYRDPSVPHELAREAAEIVDLGTFKK